MVAGASVDMPIQNELAAGVFCGAKLGLEPIQLVGGLVSMVTSHIVVVHVLEVEGEDGEVVVDVGPVISTRHKGVFCRGCQLIPRERCEPLIHQEAVKGRLLRFHHCLTVISIVVSKGHKDWSAGEVVLEEVSRRFDVPLEGLPVLGELSIFDMRRTLVLKYVARDQDHVNVTENFVESLQHEIDESLGRIAAATGQGCLDTLFG